MILVVCPNPSVDTLVTVKDFAAGTVNRALAEEHYPGGKGVHVAFAARELGEDVELLGFWAGPTGEWIRGRSEERGIRCGGPRVGGWSRSCLTLRTADRSGYNETELLGRGPEVTSAQVSALGEEFAQRAADAQFIAMSGSWPVGAEESSYASLIRTARRSGRRVILDCTGPPLSRALEQRPYAVHLNASEAGALLGIDDPESAARALAGRCEVAIVTAGSRGAFFASAGEALHAACRLEEPVGSAVGSGDCLVGGFAVGMARGLPLERAAALACACGAANCLRPELGMLHGADVTRLLERVKVGRST